MRSARLARPPTSTCSRRGPRGRTTPRCARRWRMPRGRAGLLAGGPGRRAVERPDPGSPEAVVWSRSSSARASSASRPGWRSRTCGGPLGRSSGELGALDAAVAEDVISQRRVTPTRSAGCGRRSARRTRATSLVSAGWATSASTGAAPPTSAAAATAPCIAATRSARCCSSAAAPSRRRGARPVDAARHRGGRPRPLRHRRRLRRAQLGRGRRSPRHEPGRDREADRRSAPGKPANWAQLLQVRAGRRLRLCDQPRRFRPSGRGPLLCTTPSARSAPSASPCSNFYWNRHWTFRAIRGPCRLSGGALLHGQRRGLLVNLACSRPWSAPASARLPSQAIAVATAMPFNFVGNKLWTF